MISSSTLVPLKNYLFYVCCLWMLETLDKSSSKKGPMIEKWEVEKKLEFHPCPIHKLIIERQGEIDKNINNTKTCKRSYNNMRKKYPLYMYMLWCPIRLHWCCESTWIHILSHQFSCAFVLLQFCIIEYCHHFQALRKGCRWWEQMMKLQALLRRGGQEHNSFLLHCILEGLGLVSFIQWWTSRPKISFDG
jgi:hypothetical protein